MSKGALCKVFLQDWSQEEESGPLSRISVFRVGEKEKTAVAAVIAAIAPERLILWRCDVYACLNSVLLMEHLFVYQMTQRKCTPRRTVAINEWHGPMYHWLSRAFTSPSTSSLAPYAACKAQSAAITLGEGWCCQRTGMAS